ncbi:MAG: nuclear transport factor 2 family protein [Clostridia bacterium]|nr:nuclear transport factor 2 family protein [Clostridia bacterium]
MGISTADGLAGAEQAYRDFYRCLVQQDITALAPLLDDSFVLRHVTGMRQDKKAFLKAVEDGVLHYYSAEHEQIDVQPEGADSASLAGDSMVRAAVFGGSEHDWPLRLEMHLKKWDGLWRICQVRASEY